MFAYQILSVRQSRGRLVTCDRLEPALKFLEEHSSFYDVKLHDIYMYMGLKLIDVFTGWCIFKYAPSDATRPISMKLG